MIKNYLLITLRNFLKNRNYTLINILGLSLGITCCITIFLLVTYDLSFDRFHSRYHSLYRVVQHATSASGDVYNAITPYPLTGAFRNEFPDVPLVTQLHYQDEGMIQYGADKQYVDNILFADSLFFDLFDFPVISGNPHVDLGEPGKVFLTQSLADKILKGGNNTIRFGNKVDLEVAGVVADPAPNSHIRYSMIISYSTLTPALLSGLPLDSWSMTYSGYTYVALPESLSRAQVDQRLAGLVKKYLPVDAAARHRYFLQAVPEIHASEMFMENPGKSPNIKMSQLWMMGLLAAFILLIACINFVNLATALAIRKSREIGIRKTLGARRGQLTLYFLGETLLLSVLALLISLCATEWLLPYINVFLEKQIALKLVSNLPLLAFLIALLAVTTVGAGFYPALILSGFNPVQVLKNKISATGSSGALVRKVLVISQFLIAQVLIIGTLVIAEQMSFFRNKPLGFSTEAIVSVAIPEQNSDRMASFRARMEGNTEIHELTFALGEPTSDNNFSTGFSRSEQQASERYDVMVKPADRHYLETFGIKLKAGRWFTDSDEQAAQASVPHDKRKLVYVLNEAAVRRLGYRSAEEAIGKTITSGIQDITAEVIGVVEDFHTASLHHEIQPLMFINYPEFYYVASMKISTAHLPETLRDIEKHWTEVFPDYIFEYQFLDDQLQTLYRQDERTFTLFRIFAGVSIFIGCLGLYGLVSFMANQKLKEVGVRKVMGASVGSIVVLFSREFVKLILVAFAMAAPAAWYLMHQWLQGFAYRITMPWTAYILAVGATLLIALFTVSFKSIHAARSNPAETLRSE